MHQENCSACKRHWRGGKPSGTASPGSKPDPDGERTNGPADAPTLKPREINQLLNLMGKCAAKIDDPSSVVIRSAMQEIQKIQPPETLDALLQKKRSLGEKRRKMTKSRMQLEERAQQQLADYNRTLQAL